MQANEENLKALASYLEQSVSADPNVRKQAEASLASVKTQPGFLILLMQLLSYEGVNPSLRQSGAILFKNIVKNHWKAREDENFTISESDKASVKDGIVGLMLTTPPVIRKQLSEALAIISGSDFPDKWPNLLNELVSKFATKDFNIINGILETAHSIFKKYRYQYESEALKKEIYTVLMAFQQPMLDLFLFACAQVEAQSGNVAALRVLFECINLLLKIFFSLNWVTIPEFFEDHMKDYFDQFHKLLLFENPALESDDEDEAGILDICKGIICENINLYMEKYEEEFAPFLPQFAQDVWNLLLKLGPEPKYDVLVANAIRFLTTVSKGVHHKLFESQDTQKILCEKVIIPNIKLRDQDEELFEDDPVEYIRKDIEGSDVDTRRRSASEFVKGLCTYYEQQVTQIFSGYVGAMLQEYAANPSANWKAKDAAIYLVTAIAVKAKTAAAGTTAVNQLVDVNDFLRTQIIPLIQGPGANDILKADALKYMTTFRIQIPKDVMLSIFPNIIELLRSNSRVVHTYAAGLIERLLVLRDQKTPRFTKADLKPFLATLLTNLFGALKLDNFAENEYVMKAIMRVCTVAQEEIASYLRNCLVALTNVLGIVCKNPSNPTFNHYLFESYAALIKYNCKPTSSTSVIEGFEAALFPPFQLVLQQDVSEFTPYVFQLLSQMLEARPAGPLPPLYMGLFKPLLAPATWQRPGNIPALTRLMQAYIKKAPREIIESNYFEGVLGIFQKLVSSKANDHEGFYILNSIVENMPLSAVENYLTPILKILFMRLQSARTGKFARCLVLFLALFAVKHGADTLVTKIDAVQSGLFGMIIESVWLPEVQKVSGGIERKLCSVAMTLLLTQAPAFIANDAYFGAFWGRVLLAQLKLLELPEEESEDSDEAYLEASVDSSTTAGEGAGGYTASFSQLVFASREQPDPTKDIPNAKQFFAVNLNNLIQQQGQKIVAQIRSSLAAEPAAFIKLQEYFTSFGLYPRVLG